jgi:hypothetical protein
MLGFASKHAGLIDVFACTASEKSIWIVPARLADFRTNARTFPRAYLIFRPPAPQLFAVFTHTQAATFPRINP